MSKQNVAERGALRPQQAAEWLSVSRATLDRIIRRGDLASFTVGRARFVSVAELERFVREREEEARDA